jgi:hypothetical protein
MRTIAILRKVVGLCTAAVGMFAAAPAGAVDQAPIAEQPGPKGIMPTDMVGTYAVATQACGATVTIGAGGTVQGTSIR